MEKDIFKERERAREAAHFRQEDARLIERLRQEAKLEEIAIALAEKLQVDNPDLLLRVMELGVTVDSAPAFFLAPLVQVAWAQGTVTEQERDTVLRLARGAWCRGRLAGLCPAPQVAPGTPEGRVLRHGRGGHQVRLLAPAAGGTGGAHQAGGAGLP